MRAPSLHVPNLSVPDLHVPSVPTDRITKMAKRVGRKRKRRMSLMTMARFPLLAALGWFIGWLTDPVSGAERRERLRGKATSLLHRGEEGMDQVRGQASSSFDRFAEPMAPPVPPSGPDAPYGQ